MPVGKPRPRKRWHGMLPKSRAGLRRYLQHVLLVGLGVAHVCESRASSTVHPPQEALAALRIFERRVVQGLRR